MVARLLIRSLLCPSSLDDGCLRHRVRTGGKPPNFDFGRADKSAYRVHWWLKFGRSLFDQADLAGSEFSLMSRNRLISPANIACLAGSILLVIVQRAIAEPYGGIATALVFFSTVIVCGMLGGWKSGAVSTSLGIFAAVFLFSPSYYSRIWTSPFEVLKLGTYAVLGYGFSAFCGSLRRAWKRIEDRQRRLEEEVRERKKAQAAAQARADELMVTLQSIGDGVITTDGAGRVKFLNPVAEGLIGAKTSDVQGQLLTDIFQIVNESTGEPVENPALRAIEQGTIVGMANHTILIARGGERRPIDDSAAPIRDANGQIIGSVLVFRDVSDRKLADQKLRESDQRYQAIGESIDFGVWVSDADGRNKYASDSFLRLVGMTQEEFSTSDWTKVLHPDDAEATREAWERCVRMKARWDREYRIYGRDGVWHHVLSRGVPITNEQGDVTSWVGINLDINRLKSVEAELRDADRRKDEFLATLAHELRNPLAPISNSLQILKQPSIDTGMLQQATEMMERQVHQLVRLVDDLLDVSRVMRGKIELRRERVELASVIGRAVEMVQPLLDARQHKLVQSIPSQSMVLDADPVRLSQVFGNLLINSAKYTDQNGEIRLTVTKDEGIVVVKVSDNGIGIAPELLSEVFGLFVQADHSSVKAQGGLGIGLTLVKNLVEMHAGSVEAHSEGEGKGSEFVVRLPLVMESNPIIEVQPAQPPRSSAASASGLKVLVVDDNKDAAKSLSMLLRLKGHEVQVAYCGPSALATAATYTPNMVFLDIGMPIMDGYEVSRHLRKTPGMENATLVALTGWGQAEDRKKTADAGFDHHLVKPPELSVLDKLISDLKQSLGKN